MTLLEKAKTSPEGKSRGRQASSQLIEQCEVALAYISGEITGNQASAALEVKLASLNSRAGVLLLSGIRKGVVKVEMVKP